MLQYSLCPREPQCQGDPASLLQDHHVNTQVSATAPLTVPVPSPAPLYTTQGYCCSHAGRFFKHIPGQGALTDLWGQLSLQYKWSWMAGSVSPADGSSHRCTAHRCTSPHCCCSIHLEPSPLFCSRLWASSLLLTHWDFQPQGLAYVCREGPQDFCVVPLEEAVGQVLREPDRPSDWSRVGGRGGQRTRAGHYCQVARSIYLVVAVFFFFFFFP